MAQTEYSAEMAQAHLADIVRVANEKGQVIKVTGTDDRPNAFIVPEAYWQALQATLTMVNGGRVFPVQHEAD